MIFKGRNIALIIGVFAFLCVFYSKLSDRNDLEHRPEWSSVDPVRIRQLTDDTRQLIPSPASATSSSSRRPDDGVWYEFSDAPTIVFYAYSAFVDDRLLAPELCNSCMHLLICGICWSLGVTPKRWHTCNSFLPTKRPSTRLVETRASQHGPYWRVMETGHPSTRAVNSGRQLG